MKSALYTGFVRHRRFRPEVHQFRYRVLMAFLDVDTLPESLSISPLAGYNRSSLVSYRESDHFGDPSVPLRKRVERDAELNGIELAQGPIFLLTHLRCFGYVFNPISLYYCYDRQDCLQSVMAEVNSTFGETRNYWLPKPAADGAAPIRATAAKRMHVSPFMPMDLLYDFRLSTPAASLSAHIATLDGREADKGPLFDATLTLERYPWSATELHKAILFQPWATLKVTAAIHFEALRLMLKGVPFYARPNSVS